MKVDFLVNGVSHEVDAKDIKSENDLKTIACNLLNKAQDTTDILNAAAEFEKMVKDRQDERQRKARELMDLAEKFCSAYNSYAALIKSDSQVDEAVLGIYERSLALTWNRIINEGIDKNILKVNPQLKKFCSELKRKYKNIMKA